MAVNNRFQLKLDTLAPVGSITRAAENMGENAAMTIDKGDADFMYIWFDKDVATSAIPKGTELITAVASYKTEFVTSGTYYYHVVLVDDLGNQSEIYTTAAMNFDTEKPVVTSVKIANNADFTTTREVSLEFEFSDNLSGCTSYTLSGDLAETAVKTGTIGAEAQSAGKIVIPSILLSGTGAEHKTKTINVVVTDRAGNDSIAVSDTIVLDTEFITGSIVVADSADEEAKTLNGQWTNEQNVVVKLVLASADDVVGYKIWGDVNEDGTAVATAKPGTFTSVTKGTTPIVVAMKLTAGDAENKTVSAEVIDEAGNVTVLDSVVVKADYTAPAVSIALDSTTAGYVSKVEGFNTVTITPTVDAAISGVKAYTLYLDNAETTVKGTDSIPATITFDATDMGNDGPHTFKFVVEDNAGNVTASDTKTIILDTAAPEGTVTMSGWANKTTFDALNVTASATDARSGVASMQCWCSTVASDVAATGTSYTYEANPTHAQVDWTHAAESASNYIHIKYTDRVGNFVIVHSDAFGIDRVDPTAVASFSKAAYNSTTASITITANDATSKVAEMLITGDIDGTPEWETFAATKTVNLITGDGKKTVTVKVRDAAGNTSDPVTITCELDTTAPSLVVELLRDDNVTHKEAVSSVPSFILHISAHDDAKTPYKEDDISYKVYGDFALIENQTEQTTEPADWTPVKFVTGEEYMKLGVYYATKDTSTNGEGQLKDIYVKIMDNAGNTVSKKVSFRLNQADPSVTVSDVDYNTISKVHVFRKHADASEITNKYCDEVHFSFTPDATIQAYKVCAYMTQAEAEAGKAAADSAIGTANGSSYMAATGLEFKGTINAMVKGADYEAALLASADEGVTSVDGVHFIVVYVQNMGGTWSKAIQIEA